MFSPQEQGNYFRMIQARGAPAIAAEYLFVPEGYEELKLAVKSFTLPVNVAEEMIQVNAVGGMTFGIPQLAKTYFTGAVSFIEDVNGGVHKLLTALSATQTIDNRPTLNGAIYRGAEDNYTQKWELKNISFYGFESTAVDYENRTQLTVWSGHMAYSYFGE